MDFRAEYIENLTPCVLVATVRYDDRCKNGYNSFSITGCLYDRVDRIKGEASTTNAEGVRLWMGSCGCLHADIAKHLPELAPFIKWHLCNSDKPMHYLENAMYHASVIPKEQDKYYAYLTETITGTKKLLKIVDKEKQALIDEYGDKMSFQPYYNPMAKEADLNAARSSAIWPNAELKDFTIEKLNARLPHLMREFKRDIEALGFIY